MSDSAKGPLSGYLFQFERALSILSNLNEGSDYVSIEKVDDIAAHEKSGAVLIADQSKHTISQSANTFGDTSFSLWRTIQLWVQKLEDGTFDSETSFICSTNKEIPSHFLVKFIANNDFEVSLKKIKEVLKNQKNKLDKLRLDNPLSGSSIESVLKIIRWVIKKKEFLTIVIDNIKIEDSLDLKNQTYNRLLLNSSDFEDYQKDNIYQGMIGWLASNSLFKWQNSFEAIFTKKEMDTKYHSSIKSPTIVNAIFRTREDLLVDDDKIKTKRSELFVKQIEVIVRRNDAKERILKSAIEDFIRYEIEHAFVINQIGDFTSVDFSNFINKCLEEWQNYFDTIVIHELSTYSEEEKNTMAIKIYDYLMESLKVNFRGEHTFNSNNNYIKKGSLLKLSNIPKIGWHPDWEEKFKK